MQISNIDQSHASVEVSDVIADAEGAGDAPAGSSDTEARRDGALDVLEELLELESFGETVTWPDGVSRQQAVLDLRERKELRTSTRRAGYSAPAQDIDPIPVVAAVASLAGIGVQAPMRQPNRVNHSSIRPGHTLYVSGEIVCCHTCGHWTTQKVRRDGLGAPCQPLKKSNESKLCRLRKAKHPRTQAPIPQPRRLR